MRIAFTPRLHGPHTPPRGAARRTSRRRTHTPAVVETLEARQLLSAVVAFAGRTDYPVGTNPQDIVTADFNNDGLLDIAVTNKDSGSITVYYGQATGGFGGRVDIPVSGNPIGIAAADLNNDGRADIVFATGAGDSVGILLSKPAGGFAAPIYLAAEGAVEYVTCADLNHDGHMDIAATVGYGSTSIHQVDTWYGNNNGTFTNRQHFDVGANPLGICASDLNNDGLPDLVVASGAENLVSILFNKGQCSFYTRVDAFTGTDPQSVVAADLNGDGIRDLAVADALSGVSIIDARSYGSFNAAINIPTPLRAFDIVAGDFNGDGKPDLAVTVADSNQVTMLYQQANGSYAVAESYAVGAGDTQLVAGDFNRDGKVDLATVNDTAGTISVLYGTGGDHAPTVSTISKTLNQDASLAFAGADFTSAFSDPDAGDALGRIRITALPAHGTLTVGGVAVVLNQEIAAAQIPTLVYAASPGYYGADSFGWNGADMSGVYAAAGALCNLTINHVLQPPVLSSIARTINQGAVLTFASGDFAAAFSDPDANPMLKIRITTLPAHGSLTLGGAALTVNQEITAASIASLAYTPAAAFYGVDAFNWNASDANAYALSPAAVNITVNHVDHAPTEGNISKTLTQGTTLAFAASDFTGAFADPDAGDTLGKIRILTLPANGTLKLGGAAIAPGQEIAAGSLGGITYTPAPSYGGTDSFTINAADSSGLYAPSPATVSLVITPLVHPPTVSNIARSVAQNGVLAFSAGDFTGAFTDPNAGSTLQMIQVTSLPAGGALALGGAAVAANQQIPTASLGNLTFTPTAGFTGATTFGYNASDGTAYAAAGATVTITVTAPIVPPVLADVAKTLPQDTTLTFAAPDFTAGFSDANPGGTLQAIKITALANAGTLRLGGAIITTIGQVIPANAISTLTYTPNPGYTGPDSFAWNATDVYQYASAPALVNITVTHVDHPPTVLNSVLGVTQNATLTLNAAEFNTCFTDPDAGDALSKIRITALPANGILRLNGAIITTVGQEIPTGFIGGLTYTPDTGYSGADSIGWNGADMSGSYAATPAVMSLTVNHVNHPPTVGNIARTLPEGTTLAFAAADFSGAFTDIDGNAMQKIQITALPADGVLRLNGAIITTSGQEIPTVLLGQLTYTPNAGYAGADSFGWNGADPYGYAAAPALVNLTVAHVNHPPTVAAIARNMPVNGTYDFSAPDFTAAFSDPDAGDTLQKIMITALPANGVLRLNGAIITVVGQEIPAGFIAGLTYTPNGSFSGADSFSYNGSDGQAYAASAAQFSFSITRAYQTPTLADVSKTVAQDATLTFSTADFAAAFTDANAGAALAKIQITALPSNGVLQYNGSPVLAAGLEIPMGLIPGLTYAPNAGFAGTDTFGWNGTDATAYAAAPALVTIGVTRVNHAPTEGTIAKTLVQDNTLTFSLLDFSGAFNDPAGATLQKIEITALPANGTLRLNGAIITTVGQEVAAAYLGGLTYTPNSGFSGSDAFAVMASDGTLYSAAANVQLTIQSLLNAATPGYLSPIAPVAGDAASFFDQTYYLAHNPDVAAAVAAGTMTALQHFLNYGQYEGRAPSTVYNEAYYLAHNPDVAAAVDNHTFADGFQHFVNYGYMEGRGATPTPGYGAAYESQLSPLPGNAASFFDEAYYLSRNVDVRVAVHAGTIASGLAHFLEYGQYEGRQPSSIYDESYYLAENPSVAAAKANHSIADGFQQFIDAGFWNGLLGNSAPANYVSPLTPVTGDAATFFDDVYYLENNPDVRTAVFNGSIASGLDHFLKYGQFEGRRPSTQYDESYYLAHNPDVAAAVANHSLASGFYHWVNYGWAEGRLAVAP